MDRDMNGHGAVNQSDKAQHSEGKTAQDSPARFPQAKLADTPVRLPAKPTSFLPPMPNGGIGVMQWGLND